MKLHYMPQRSDEWYQIRCGRFTASDFDSLMPSSRQKENEFNKTQMSIIYRVAAERITNQCINDGYISKPMQHGIDTEDEAIVAFEMMAGLSVERVGFAEFDEWLGCSPDGLIGEDFGIEVKCPNSDTHLRYFLNPSELYEDYKYQVQGNLLCTERKIWHLISYDNRFPVDKQGIIYQVNRDEETIDLLRRRLSTAIEKCKLIIDEITK